jgi:hypothetical protein
MTRNGFSDRLCDPPNREWFFQPDPDAPVIQGASYAALYQKLLPFYKEGPPEDLREQVEEYMCRFLPAGFCRQKGEFAGVSLRQVVSFTEFMGRTMLQKLRKGRAVYVEEEEAWRRAEICKTCPFHAPSFCSSCLGLSQKVMSMLPAERRAASFGKLGACTKCGCLLQAKVNFDKSVLKSLVQRDLEYPSHCWMKEHE